VAEAAPRDLNARDIARQIGDLVGVLNTWDPWPMGKWDGLPAYAKPEERWSSKSAHKRYSDALGTIRNCLGDLRREYDAQLKIIEKAQRG
jgi:hypothetical protein